MLAFGPFAGEREAPTPVAKVDRALGKLAGR